MELPNHDRIYLGGESMSVYCIKCKKVHEETETNVFKTAFVWKDGVNYPIVICSGNVGSNDDGVAATSQESSYIA